MVLHVDSYASYLTIPGGRSCYTGHFYLSDWPSPKPIKPNPKRNSPIHIEFKTICNVVSSVAETKICGTFNNGKTAISMRPALIALDKKQPVIPLKTENSTTEVFLNSGMEPKISKTWSMKWHWFRYKEFIDKLRAYWYRGTNNDADYFTKHHLPIHHCQVRPWYIHTSNLLRTISQTIR